MNNPESTNHIIEVIEVYNFRPPQKIATLKFPQGIKAKIGMQLLSTFGVPKKVSGIAFDVDRGENIQDCLVEDIENNLSAGDKLSLAE